LKTIEVGFVERAHGLRGELRIRSHFAGSEALSQVDHVTLTLGKRSQVFEIEAVRASGAAQLVVLKGIASREDAEGWRGAAVVVDRDELPALEEGEYYLNDLLGAVVSDADGRIGVVTEIAMHPSVDSVIIQTDEGTSIEQPLVEAWIERVDTAAGVLVLKSRDGFIL
jgi:16S rRNA processing protein RimM